MYIIGGRSIEVLNTTFKINLKIKEMIQRSSMNEARTAMGICNIGKHIYVAGGWPPTETCEIYDIIKDKWSMMKASMREEKCSVTLMPLRKRYIYAFGGRGDYNDIINRFYYLDITQL